MGNRVIDITPGKSYAPIEVEDNVLSRRRKIKEALEQGKIVTLGPAASEGLGHFDEETNIHTSVKQGILG